MRSRAGDVVTAAVVCLAALAACSGDEPPDPAPSSAVASATATRTPEGRASIDLAVDGVPVEEDWLDLALCTTTGDRLSFAAAGTTSSVTGEIVLDGGPTLRAVVYTRGVTTYTSDLLDPGTVIEAAGGYEIATVVVEPGGGDAYALDLTVTCEA